MYLTDHEGKSAANDNRKFWERKLNKVLGGEEGCEREDIPSFLTPDADRGVVYSDEIIEMKGKLTLHMAQDPPHILYANDTFVHNTGKSKPWQVENYDVFVSQNCLSMTFPSVWRHRIMILTSDITQLVVCADTYLPQHHPWDCPQPLCLISAG